MTGFITSVSKKKLSGIEVSKKIRPFVPVSNLITSIIIQTLCVVIVPQYVSLKLQCLYWVNTLLKFVLRKYKIKVTKTYSAVI